MMADVVASEPHDWVALSTGAAIVVAKAATRGLSAQAVRSTHPAAGTLSVGLTLHAGLRLTNTFLTGESRLAIAVVAAAKVAGTTATAGHASAVIADVAAGAVGVGEAGGQVMALAVLAHSARRGIAVSIALR